MWKIKSVAFVLTWLVTTVALADQTWVYTDITSLKKPDKVVTRDAIEIQAGSRLSVTLGDVGYDARFCSKDSLYVCVKSPVFEFGVPKKMMANTQQWTVNNAEYQVMGEDSIHLLGRKFKILYIDRKTKDGGVRYIYSPSSGLLGFTPWSKNKSRLYLLEGQTGFGAERTH